MDDNRFEEFTKWFYEQKDDWDSWIKEKESFHSLIQEEWDQSDLAKGFYNGLLYIERKLCEIKDKTK